MSNLVTYLDGRYQDRLLELKLEVLATVGVLVPNMSDEELHDVFTKIWSMYATFVNTTVLHVEPWINDSCLDSREEHERMMTKDYILTYVGNTIFLAIINTIEAIHAKGELNHVVN